MALPSAVPVPPDTTTAPEPQMGALVVLPLHALLEGDQPIRVKRKPGRPRKVFTGLTVDERDYQQYARQEYLRQLDADPLRAAIAQPHEPEQLLSHLMTEVADEAAQIRWLRQEAAERGSADAALRASARHVRALMVLAQMLATTAELQAAQPPADALDRLWRQWRQMVTEAAVASLPEGDAEALLARLPVGRPAAR